MVENISKIQQLLAESKFVEAQKEAEFILNQCKGSEPVELLELYFNSLSAQSRPLPRELVFTLIQKILPLDSDQAQSWLEKIPQKNSSEAQRTLVINITIADLKGRTEVLYKLISEYQMLRYEASQPAIPEFIQILTKKYFPHDFHIQLQRLALGLMRLDLKTCEGLVQELILSCYEKSSPRGTKEKLNSLYEVLGSAERLYHLEIYRNLCLLLSQGLSDKKDYKKIIELVIFTEDFRFQSLVLDLLVKMNHMELASDYAKDVKNNAGYNYVYLDKFLPHLKKLFFQKTKNKSLEVSEDFSSIDLKVTKTKSAPFQNDPIEEASEEELLLAHVLKHQTFSTHELLDISVSFVQSEYYYSALKAAQLAYDSTADEELRLKASYLKVTCLLKTGDYRAALDVSLDALSFSKTQNDVLSFMYSQAESHLRLKEFSSAKSVLKKIISIDSEYRLAKERLDQLNAV